MRRWPGTAPLLLAGSAISARAEIVACPRLSTAVRVAACPSDEQLRVTFVGYCGDDARAYDLADKDTCASYENHRCRKNVALWEADGGFRGNLSCELGAEGVRQLRPAAIAVRSRGTFTRVVCSYPQGVTFVHRTRSACTVAGNGDYQADPAASNASCN